MHAFGHSGVRGMSMASRWTFYLESGLVPGLKCCSGIDAWIRYPSLSKNQLSIPRRSSQVLASQDENARMGDSALLALTELDST